MNTVEGTPSDTPPFIMEIPSEDQAPANAEYHLVELPDIPEADMKRLVETDHVWRHEFCHMQDYNSPFHVLNWIESKSGSGRIMVVSSQRSKTTEPRIPGRRRLRFVAPTEEPKGLRKYVQDSIAHFMRTEQGPLADHDIFRGLCVLDTPECAVWSLKRKRESPETVKERKSIVPIVEIMPSPRRPKKKVKRIEEPDYDEAEFFREDQETESGSEAEDQQTDSGVEVEESAEDSGVKEEEPAKVGS